MWQDGLSVEIGLDPSGCGSFGGIDVGSSSRWCCVSTCSILVLHRVNSRNQFQPRDQTDAGKGFAAEPKGR